MADGFQCTSGICWPTHWNTLACMQHFSSDNLLSRLQSIFFFHWFHQNTTMNSRMKWSRDWDTLMLMGDPATLRRWMINGPELARVVIEVEVTITSPWAKFQWSTPYPKDEEAFVATTEGYGNLFLEESLEFLVLHSKDIMPEHIVGSIKNAHQIEYGIW